MGFVIYRVRNYLPITDYKYREYNSTLLMGTNFIWTVGLVNLESINLSFTVITDGGLRKLSGLSSLKSLNLDARQITDSGLASLTSKYTWTVNDISYIAMQNNTF